MQIQTPASASSAKKMGVGGMILLVLFGLFFAGMGSFFLAMMLLGKMEDEGDVWVGYVVSSVFIAVGLGIAGGGIIGWKKSKTNAILAAQHPDDPWVLNKQWASGRIKDSNAAGAMGMLFFALFWNAISWTITIAFFREGKQEEEAAMYFVLLFPFVGIFIAWSALHALLKWFKFGSSVFEMAEVPGVIGGQLGGIIRAKAGVRPREGIKLALQCIFKKVTGSGKNQRTHEETLWEKEQLVPQSDLQASGMHSLIPVFFDIPYECKPTEEISPSQEHYWKLSATAKLDGIDYAADFVVPVFKTADSRPDATRADTAGADTKPFDVADAVALKEAGIVLSETASGAELHFERGRRALYALFPLAIGGAMTFGAVAMGIFSDIPLIFPIFIGGFGLFVEISSLAFLVGKVSLRVDATHLEYRKAGLGGAKQERIPAESITSIEPYSTMTVNSTAFYGFKVERSDGKTLNVPANIKGRLHADTVCRILKRHLKR